MIVVVNSAGFCLHYFMCHVFVFLMMFFGTHYGLKAANILEGHSIGCCPKGNPS